MKETTFFLAILIGIGALVLRDLLLRRQRGRREKYITAYRFPPTLVRRYAEAHPALDATQVRKVFEGLRQYFLACLSAQRRPIATSVGMPSRAVDDAWHDFILVTRDYQDFCREGFGTYLHHTPEGLMGGSMRDALANTLHQLRQPLPGGVGWAMAGTIPLLFAMDRELGLQDGFHHDAETLGLLEGARQRLMNERALLHGRSGGGSTSGCYGAGCATGEGGGSCAGSCGGGCGS